MHILIKNILIVAVLTIILSACNGFFEKDNTPEPKPLTNIAAQIHPHRLWTVRTGSGTNDEYLKMSPALGERAVFTASKNGTLTAINKITGHMNWQVDTKLSLLAGPGIGDGIVVVGSRKGDVLALRQFDGKLLWKTNVPGEILAKPAVSNRVVVIKAINGDVRGFSTEDGSEVWRYQEAEPSMILRGASAPLITDQGLIIGFANGHLAKFNLNDGRLFWMQAVASPQGGFPIQRMIDIDANPVLYQHHLYAATYQGKIASLDWNDGHIRWSYDLSSYTGMVADEDTVFISDANSYIFAFNAESGMVNWRQADLYARIVSGPADMGPYIVVGDGQGFLHWLDKRDGRIVGREFAGSAIYASPIVENNVLYALTNNGYLMAYTLGS